MLITFPGRVTTNGAMQLACVYLNVRSSLQFGSLENTRQLNSEIVGRWHLATFFGCPVSGNSIETACMFGLNFGLLSSLKPGACGRSS